jgi:hypothetical protein
MRARGAGRVGPADPLIIPNQSIGNDRASSGWRQLLLILTSKQKFLFEIFDLVQVERTRYSPANESHC